MYECTNPVTTHLQHGVGVGVGDVNLQSAVRRAVVVRKVKVFNAQSRILYGHGRKTHAKVKEMKGEGVREDQEVKRCAEST